MKNFGFSFFLFILVAVSFVALPIAPARAAGDEGNCGGKYLEPTEEVDSSTNISREKHSLLELIDSNQAKNLAFQYPSIVMNAAQRSMAEILSRGVKVIPNPVYYSGSVNYYPIFSEGTALTNGRRIIGLYPQIASFVSGLQRAAEGDGSSSKMPLFVGPPGTGKTEFLNILKYMARNLETNDPRFFNYSYEWHDLAQIPELRPFLNITRGADGKIFEHPFPCPLHHSPIVLLPETVMDKVIDFAHGRAFELAHADPTPPREPCPQCDKIRTAILNYEMDQEHKTSLSPTEIVQILNKYVTIKRYVSGRGGSYAKINAQGKDVDYAGLTVRPNPIVATQFGSSHPFSYFLDGTIMRGDGGFLFLDEFLRNDPALQDMFLEIIENRELSRGGSPTIQLNNVIAGAANLASVAKARQDEKQSARLDRMAMIPMFYELNPTLIAETMLDMKGEKSLRAVKLQSSSESEEQPLEEVNSSQLGPISIDELFPMPKQGARFLGPDYRYKVFVHTADGDVHLSPHVLEYISQVTALTRMNFDAKAASEKGPFKVISSAVFFDPITRLKVQMRDFDLSASEGKEMVELSALLAEGSSGLTTRDAANIWLTRAISEAQKPENGGCLTPMLARKVFKSLLADGSIQVPDNQTRLLWLRFADMVARNLLVPKLEEDVNTAIGSGVASITNVYDEVFNEMLALQKDPTAMQFSSPSGEVKMIDRGRLKEIMDIYLQSERRPLDIGEIVLSQATHYQSASGEMRRHEGLMNAIKRYFARKSKDLASLDDLLTVTQTGAGSAAVRARHSHIGHMLEHEMGYCPVCMRSALDLERELELEQAQIKAQEHSH